MKNAKTSERNWETCPIKNRDQENLRLRLRYGESLKQYRNTLRKKKEHHVRNQINVTEESIHILTTSGKIDEISIQNGDIWINHFSNLFDSRTKNKQQKHIHDQIQILESTVKDYQNPPKKLTAITTEGYTSTATLRKWCWGKNRRHYKIHVNQQQMCG